MQSPVTGAPPAQAATYWVIDLQYLSACIHTSLISISPASKSTCLIKAGGGWMAFFEKPRDAPEEKKGGRASLLPRQIWIKSIYCRIKAGTINISSQENLLVVEHPLQPFPFLLFLSSSVPSQIGPLWAKAFWTSNRNLSVFLLRAGFH